MRGKGNLLGNIVILQSGRGDMDEAELMRFFVIISYEIKWDIAFFLVCVFRFNKLLIAIICQREYFPQINALLLRWFFC